MRKFGTIAIVASIFGLLAVPAASQAHSLYFGISANSRNAGVAAQELAAETGVTSLREDLEWSAIEPADDEWKWSATDTMYKTAAERGMGILPIPDGSPCWAVPKETPPEKCGDILPESNAEYGEFVAEVAKRYGPGGDFWAENPKLNGNLARPQIEIWNEPYLIEEAENAARYAGLYVAAVAAGRLANPATRYLIESTVDARTGPEKFVPWAETIVKAQPSIKNYIDGIAVHPYPGSHGPTYQPVSGTDDAFENTRINYERWKALGVNKPVWITEVGYSSCDDGAEDDCVGVVGSTQTEREEEKAKLLTELLAELGKEKFAYVHAVYLYNLEQFTPAAEPDSKKSHWYGIAYGPTNEHLPAWNSFTAAVAKYAGVPAPQTTITGHTVNGSNASFSFTADDPTSSAECQLDAGSWAPCTSPKSYSGVSAGSHTVRVRASNAEATGSVQTYSWSSIYLRPNADKATAGWSVVGASSGWDALNDSVTESQTPNGTDYINYVGGIPATRQVDLDNPSPPSPLLLSATAWFYTPDSTPIAMKVNRVDPLFGNQTIATKVSSSAGWQSVSVPISEGFFPPHQISLDSANLGFSASGLSNGIRRVYAAFIQINTEP